MNWTPTLNKDRAAGIIVRDGKILVIHRIRDDKEYWVIPGGGVEAGESIEEALERELAEELGIQVVEKSLLFQLEKLGRQEYFYKITKFHGVPKMSGPELERASDTNQYMLEELDKSTLLSVNLLPEEVKDKIYPLL